MWSKTIHLLQWSSANEWNPMIGVELSVCVCACISRDVYPLEHNNFHKTIINDDDDSYDGDDDDSDHDDYNHWILVDFRILEIVCSFILETKK